MTGDLFDAPPEHSATEALVVDVDGFEGPLDLLLELARRQKVDLARISILALAEQYLAFVEEARKLRLELAADYLVMAAWLAYLKSRLLLPDPPKGEEPPAAELAAALALRLRRHEAMRRAANELRQRPQLGRDLFVRGMPGGIYAAGAGGVATDASLHDLLSAYAQMRQRNALAYVPMPVRDVWTLAEARAVLEQLFSSPGDWRAFDGFLRSHVADDEPRATVRASCFSAVLELAKEGRLALRQDGAFGDLYLKPREQTVEPPAGGAV